MKQNARVQVEQQEIDNKQRVVPEQARRQLSLDWMYSSASVAIAGVVGLGEALVAVYFMGLVGLMPILSLAIPAFIVNFMLFRSDTYQFLKSFGNGELFRDKNNKSFKGKTRAFLIFTMGLAFFAGISCGFLQLNSILTTFGGLFWGISAAIAISAPPLGLILVASTVAFISAIANTALLYANVEKFIKEKEYQKYIDIFDQIFGRGKYKHQKVALGWKFYHGFFAIFGLTAAVAVYVISLGLYQAQALTVFRNFCHLSAKTSNILTYIVVHATGQLLNGFFYARNMLTAVQRFEEGVKFTFVSCFDIAKRVFNKSDDNYNPDCTKKIKASWTLIAKFCVSVAIFAGLFYCCFKNGAAQGRGAMSEPRSLAWLEALKLPKWLAEKIAFISMSVGSTSANAVACRAEVEDKFKASTQHVKQLVRNFICSDSSIKKQAPSGKFITPAPIRS